MISVKAGDIVVVKSALEAFGETDSWEEHYFLVHEAYEDVVTGIALTGSLAKHYGEPSLSLIKKVYNEATL